MKKLLSLFAFSLFGLQPLLADWVIVQKVVSDGKKSDMTLRSKGDKSRMDVGEKMSLILDSATNETVMLMHPQKMVMDLSGSGLKGLMAIAGQAVGNDDSAAKPTATGQMEKVGEYDCEIYTWSGKLGSGKFWVAKTFPEAQVLNEIQDKMMNSMGNPMAALVPKNTDFPGMVMKSEMEVLGKKNSAELVSAKQEPVSDEAFKTPEGYQTMKKPSLLGK